MHAKFQVNTFYRKKVIQCIGFPIDIYSANTNTHNFLPVAWIDLKFHTHICISTMSLCVKFQVNPFCRKKVIKCIGFPIGNYHSQCKGGGRLVELHCQNTLQCLIGGRCREAAPHRPNTFLTLIGGGAAKRHLTAQTLI